MLSGNQGFYLNDNEETEMEAWSFEEGISQDSSSDETESVTDECFVGQDRLINTFRETGINTTDKGFCFGVGMYMITSFQAGIHEETGAALMEAMTNPSTRETPIVDSTLKAVSSFQSANEDNPGLMADAIMALYDWRFVDSLGIFKLNVNNSSLISSSSMQELKENLPEKLASLFTSILQDSANDSHFPKKFSMEFGWGIDKHDNAEEQGHSFTVSIDLGNEVTEWIYTDVNLIETQIGDGQSVPFLRIEAGAESELAEMIAHQVMNLGMPGANSKVFISLDHMMFPLRNDGTDIRTFRAVEELAAEHVLDASEHKSVPMPDGQIPLECRFFSEKASDAGPIASSGYPGFFSPVSLNTATGINEMDFPECDSVLNI